MMQRRLAVREGLLPVLVLRLLLPPTHAQLLLLLLVLLAVPSSLLGPRRRCRGRVGGPVELWKVAGCPQTGCFNHRKQSSTS